MCHILQVMRSPKQPAELAMLLLLSLLLLCNGVGKVHGKTIHENSVDLHALLDFKQGITGDPQGGSLEQLEHHNPLLSVEWCQLHHGKTVARRAANPFQPGLSRPNQLLSWKPNFP
jgi:hypothetical protein